MTEKKSIWEDKDCTGWKEIQARKQFYGYSAVSSKAAQLGGGIDISDLTNSLATTGVYEEVLSGSLYIPQSSFSWDWGIPPNQPSKSTLDYLENGYEAFDIY